MISTLDELSRLLTTAFAITSLLSMGLSLTVSQIIEPLLNLRRVLLALVASFVVVPAVAFALASILPLELDQRIALVLFAMVAGSPLVPKLTEIAKGDVPFAVGLVAVLVASTLIYVSVVLPPLLPDAHVDTLAIAQPLFLQLLLPLFFGLLVRARSEEEAGWLQPIAAEIASTSLTFLLVITLLQHIGTVLGLLLSWAFVAILLLIAVALVVGYLLGGPERGGRVALALGTGQRNYAAALVLGAGSFANRPEVLVVVAAASVVSLFVMLLLAGELGRRA